MRPIEKVLLRTDVETAAKSLELTESIDTVSHEAVKEAYRKILMSSHPDTSNLTPTEAADRIIVAKAARALLDVWISGRPKVNCTLCGGSGHVPGWGFSTVPCPRCS